MPFAADRDLLILEPLLFRDVTFTAQRLVTGTASIAGSTLTAGGGVDFAAQGVGAGHVALVDGVPVEVLARLTSTTLTVSRPRAMLDDPPTPPMALTSKPLTVWTFLPQIQVAHEQVLRMVGIEPIGDGGGGVPGAITESAITNPRSLRLVESLAALHLIFSAAAAQGGSGSLSQRAEMYRVRFEMARRVAAVRLDLDGDGVPDATRHLGSTPLTRA